MPSPLDDLIFGRLSESEKTAALSVTHAPKGKGGTNWITKSKPGNRGQLPAYIQNVRNAIMRGGKTIGEATAIAISRIRAWKDGRGNVGPEVRAAAAKAIAEYDAMRGKSKLREAACPRELSEALDDMADLLLNEAMPELLAESWIDALHPRGFAGLFRKKSGGGQPPPRTPRSRAGGAAPQPPAIRSRGLDQKPRELRTPGGSPVGKRLTEEELKSSVGTGPWTKNVQANVERLSSGLVEDSERLFRGEPDAQGRFSRSYPPERVELHARIVNQLLQGAGFHPGAKKALFTAGGPASGKSSILPGEGRRHAPVTPEPDAVIVNPDIVKTMLPEYAELVKRDPETAAGLMHEESSHISKRLLELAMLRDHHLVVDSVGAGKPGRFAGKVTAALDAGYDAEVAYVSLNTDEAFRRAEARAKRTGRVVNEAYFRVSHQQVSERFAEIKRLKGVRVRVFDNNVPKGKAPVPVYDRGRDGHERVLREAAYLAFLAKARAKVGQ